LPEVDTRRQSRPAREMGSLASNERRPEANPGNLPRVAPTGAPALPAIAGATGLTRPPADVPAIYRSRLDANRSALARRAGASSASEEAVERALLWLSRHQDADGRWDGATAKYRDGTVVEGDDDYTTHCPPGDVCFGECYYWEADTALTGLALLAYLGAGYTHLDGQYTDTVARGLEFLRLSQKPDGDLRGRSQAVGMYCHAMATLALCEAYALTGDPKLRAPVERAVNFLLKARAQDGLAWRYAPGAPVGDTSILGWVVMCLKSAQEVGIPIAGATKQGVLTWLNKVAAGPSNGLARYQPWEKVTPTMTAEAWVCRQFLGVGGPGASSREAAEYLLRGGAELERTQFNLYYLYYGTLAMYQQGGDAWTRWNVRTRDEVLRRQRLQGHASGSWDPDESQYGTHGGRIYCTALATLSLEVYYRYLRLYEAPATSPTPPPRRTAEIISEPAPPR
ncbi:MAG TPA: prenyltransferase/squalene oxidase repeat-containing protein, partial [Isosphaeraceae bacterium]|nr:prenyltransferase/squalene oxidase repeat-containing protein [Isosphaeraceae bacterium]